jgi:protein-disulfide isomerase
MVREQLAREARRRRTILVSVLAAAALIIAGLIGWGVYETQRPKSHNTPAHATASGTGIVVANGPVPVDLYIDYMCPHCKEFEQSAEFTIDQLVSSGKIKLTYHPIAILDQASSPPGYSTRAGSAAGCASDGGKFLAYTKALFAQQPQEGSAGLSADQLIQIGRQVGLTDSSFAQCVRAGQYNSWMTHNTDVAASQGVQGTPTILVAGNQVTTPTGDALAAAVAAA